MSRLNGVVPKTKTFQTLKRLWKRLLEFLTPNGHPTGNDCNYLILRAVEKCA